MRVMTSDLEEQTDATRSQTEIVGTHRHILMTFSSHIVAFIDILLLIIIDKSLFAVNCARA